MGGGGLKATKLLEENLKRNVQYNKKNYKISPE